MNQTADAANLALLKRVQPLALLGEDSLRELLPLCRRETCRRGQDPVVEHNWTGQLVYLAKGELIVSSAQGGKDVVVGGSGRALLPIWRQGMQSVTKAITDVELLGVAEDTVDVMATWDQLAIPLPVPMKKADHTADSTDWRHMSGMFAVHNLTNGVFSSLPPANIGRLLERFAKSSVKRGDVIVRQGEEGDFYYLIERGRCKVTRLVGGAAMELAELREGDAFGEEALVADSLRNASIAGIVLKHCSLPTRSIQFGSPPRTKQKY